jgi:hypothetical protein
MKLVKFGNVLVNPQYVIAVQQTMQEGHCCLCFAHELNSLGKTKFLVKGTLEQVAERLGATIG